MKYPCDMIQDLLPLYHDGVCSGESKTAVEAHLAECGDCRRTWEKMQDDTYADQLREEKQEILRNYKRGLKNKVLLVLLLVLAVPVVTCFIVNLALDRRLDWFFIVLTAMLMLASLTAIPLAVARRRFSWTLGGFTASLLLLLLSCDLYSGGGWFLLAAVPSLFGLAVVFLPFVLHQLPLRGFAARHKGLIAMATDTALLYALLAVCGLGADASYWAVAFPVATVLVAFVWLLFAILRYLPVNGLLRAGLCTLASGAFVSAVGDVLYAILEGEWHLNLTQADFSVWNSVPVINANIYLLALLAGCLAGGALLLAGALRARKKRREASPAPRA